MFFSEFGIARNGIAMAPPPEDARPSRWTKVSARMLSWTKARTNIKFADQRQHFLIHLNGRYHIPVIVISSQRQCSMGSLLCVRGLQLLPGKLVSLLQLQH